MKYRIAPSLHKTLSFGVLHLVIAVTVGYLLTGSFVLATTLALVEPAVNTVAHFFFDRWWERGRSANRSAAAAA